MILPVLLLAGCLAALASGGAAAQQRDSIRVVRVVIPDWTRLQAILAADSAPAISYTSAIPASEFDTAPEKSDQRRLMLGTCPNACRFGPFARIHPRVRSTSWSSARGDSGEVIARIISDSAYPKFNIHGRDTVYWWVGKRGRSQVSVFTSTAPGAKPLVSDLEVIPHGREFLQGIALARWLWNDVDDMTWGTCDGGACCRSSGR